VKIIKRKQCNSTQRIASNLALKGVDDLTVIASELQTNGIGRYGKTWESNQGGLWMTVILRKQIPVKDLPYLALSVGIEVYRVLSKLGLETLIKYPNDILVDEDGQLKKLAGILCSSSIKGNNVVYTLVGLGLNVNNEPPSNGTSLKKLGLKLSVDETMSLMIKAIDKATIGLIKKGSRKVLENLKEIKCLELPLEILSIDSN